VTLLKNDLTFWQLFTGAKSSPDFDAENYKLLQTKGKKYGGVMELGSPLILVNDLDIIKQIMVKDFDHFVDRRDFADTDPFFSKNLSFLQGQDWREMRGFLSPTFTSGKIKRMFHHFQNGSERLQNYIEKFHERKGAGGGYNVVVPNVIGRFTADVIGAVAFGMETDCLTNADSLFYKMAIEASDFLNPKRIFKFAMLSLFPSVANFLRMEVEEKHVSVFFTNILIQTFKARENSGQQREDFLQLLIEAKEGRLKDFNTSESDSTVNETNEQSKPPKFQLTTEMATAQAFLFFLAGLANATQKQAWSPHFAISICPQACIYSNALQERNSHTKK
jgi:cytochrome P450